MGNNPSAYDRYPNRKIMKRNRFGADSDVELSQASFLTPEGSEEDTSVSVWDWFGFDFDENASKLTFTTPLWPTTPDELDDMLLISLWREYLIPYNLNPSLNFNDYLTAKGRGYPAILRVNRNESDKNINVAFQDQGATDLTASTKENDKPTRRGARTKITRPTFCNPAHTEGVCLYCGYKLFGKTDSSHLIGVKDMFINLEADEDLQLNFYPTHKICNSYENKMTSLPQVLINIGNGNPFATNFETESEGFPSDIPVAKTQSELMKCWEQILQRLKIHPALLEGKIVRGVEQEESSSLAKENYLERFTETPRAGINVWRIGQQNLEWAKQGIEAAKSKGEKIKIEAESNYVKIITALETQLEEIKKELNAVKTERDQTKSEKEEKELQLTAQETDYKRILENEAKQMAATELLLFSGGPQSVYLQQLLDNQEKKLLIAMEENERLKYKLDKTERERDKQKRAKEANQDKVKKLGGSPVSSSVSSSVNQTPIGGAAPESSRSVGGPTRKGKELFLELTKPYTKNEGKKPANKFGKSKMITSHKKLLLKLKKYRLRVTKTIQGKRRSLTFKEASAVLKRYSDS